MDKRQRTDPLSVLQLAMSVLAFLAALVIGALLLLTVTINSSGAGLSDLSSLPIVSYAWVSALVAVLLVPSIIFTSLRLLGNPAGSRPAMRSLGLASACMVFWPVVLFLGFRLAGSPNAWLVVPPLQILAVGLPIWFIFELGRWSLPSGSPQRISGLLGVGITLTPILITTIEAILLIVVLTGALFVIGAQPDFIEQLNQLTGQFSGNPADAQVVDDLTRQALLQPGAITLMLIFIAGLVPVIEEILKSLGMWFLAGKRITPSQGFVAGMICGATFALVESLGISTNFAGADWLSTVIQRFGTGLLHVTATGLTGWGLASAWSEKKYLRLAGCFITAVLLHSIWNIFGLLMGFTPYLGEEFTAQLPVASGLGNVAPYMLIIESIVMLFILLSINRRIRSQMVNEPHAVEPQPPAPLSPAT
jgi:hypothetical protein